MWYWHAPFRLAPDDLARLRRMGVGTLYVRAGTFSSDGKRAVVVLPQRWDSGAPGLGVVLTMNFDPGLVSHLETISAERLAADVARGLEDARKAAKGARFEGYQLDVDCPTRLLPRYTDLLRRVRAKVGGPLSITALPTWLGSPYVRDLADAVDFIAPQFYENRTGRTLATLEPVSDPAALRRGLMRLRDLGVPFRAGLSAYGHALLYDPRGSLAGMYRGLSPEDALRHPSLRPEAVGPLEAERRLVLRAVAPDAGGRGLGVRIAYVLPTAEALRRQLSAYRKAAPPNALGPILYRFPEPGEAMTLPLSTVEAALKGAPARTELEVSATARAVPWDLVAPDARAARPPQAVVLRATAVGGGPSEAEEGAVQVLVRFDRPGIDGAAPGDFDSAEVGSLDPGGAFRRGSGVRANAVLLRRGHVLPGESLRSGAIETRADGATSVVAEWSVRSPDGDTRGTSARVRLGRR